MLKKALPLLLITALCLLSSCSFGGKVQKSDPMIGVIVSTTEPIDPTKPLPQFTEYFQSGATAIYTYVAINNTDAMTGSIAVRLRWFYPNDFSPPAAQRTVEVQPGQNVAQFEIHDEKGLPNGPYMLIPAIGKDEATLTETGSARVFIGMTQKEAETFLKEEMDYRKARDEAMKKREEQEALQMAISASGATVKAEGVGLPWIDDFVQAEREKSMMPPG